MKQRKSASVLSAGQPDPQEERGNAMERAAIARTESESASPLSDASHRSLASWVRRRAGSSDHERRVAQIAGALFDLTQDLHDLSQRAQWTLIAAALVHDVGKSVDNDEHARIGANIILTDATLDLSSTSRRWLAYLTLYHRGQVPAPGKDEVLRPSDDARGLLKMLAILRAADTLDSRSLEVPRLLMMRRENRLRIGCYLREVDPRAFRAFCRPKKYRLLEQTLNCDVDVEVHFGDTKILSA
jgi:exopolyphosphatase/pppGpp-phosphohydrolase